MPSVCLFYFVYGGLVGWVGWVGLGAEKFRVGWVLKSPLTSWIKFQNDLLMYLQVFNRCCGIAGWVVGWVRAWAKRSYGQLVF